MILITSTEVPWEFGENAATYMAKYLDIRHRLMPYLYYHVCVNLNDRLNILM
jgi:alpha-glucosidase (family GH31 glycosyl hydrolase)